MSLSIYPDLIKIWPHAKIGNGKLWFVNRTLRVHSHKAVKL